MKKHLVITGLQWGDEGKGKVVDCLSGLVDSVVRFQGGNNAGHTLKVGEEVYKLNLVPSGIVSGKKCLIDSGTVVDPEALLEEINRLKARNIDAQKLLKISPQVCLVLTLHREVEFSLATSKRVGTTSKGIGPAYEDKIGRRAIRLIDLFGDPASLEEKVEILVEYHNVIKKGLGQKLANHKGLLDQLKTFAPLLEPFVATQKDLEEMEQGRILFEGSQGAMLDIDHGTYPFVTSSNTLPAQCLIGSTLSPKLEDLFFLGVMKAYSTRVGEGPFITQAVGEEEEKLQNIGDESGTVTQRRRRCGWTDIPHCAQIAKITRMQGLFLTKIDVLDHFETIKVCTKYHENGEPIYQEVQGWKDQGYCSGVTDAKDLPANALIYIRMLEEAIGVPIYFVSTGQERKSIIELRPLD